VIQLSPIADRTSGGVSRETLAFASFSYPTADPSDKNGNRIPMPDQRDHVLCIVPGSKGRSHMMSKKEKKPHLGRGLASLLGPVADNPSSPESPDKAISFPPDVELATGRGDIPIDALTPNRYQPRTTWDPSELEDLAASIRANGVIQPILVRRVENRFEVIAGERRLRAAKQAGLETVPVIIRHATDEQMLELALVENIHRTDLNPIERASAYGRYIETFNLTHAEAAQRLGEDRTVISNYLRLLDLPGEVKEMLVGGRLSMGHGRALLGLPTDELRSKLANRAMTGRLSVREVERLVRRAIEGEKPEKALPKKEPFIEDLERRMEEILGTRVQIQARKRGQRGRIIIDFYSLDDFDRLARRIGLDEVERV
jgi:ParB family transcriptional regulator, chromosome partitioning protein